MTPIAIPSLADFLMQLVNFAARAIFLAGAAGVGLAALRVKTTPPRLFVWKMVLCAALAMPALTWVLPALTIRTPSIFSFAARQVASQPLDTRPPLSSMTPARAKASAASNETTTAVLLHPAHSTAAPSVASRPVVKRIPWPVFVLTAYFSVAVLLLMRMSIGLILGHRLMRRAKEIREPRLTMSLARCARSFKLTSVPRCAESDLTCVPVTMGVLRPTILLPAGWHEWEHAKLEAVIAHEVSHVARRDALTQALSLLHRAIFWFSPLAWWLDRHLAALAEQASDEAALSRGADSNDYARALLGFFEALHAAPGRVWWQGVAMAKAGQAERRLEKILAWKHAQGAVTMGLKKPVIAIIVVLAVPFVFLAASVRPAQDQGSQEIQQPPAPQAPDKPSAASPMANPPSPAGPIPPPSEGMTVVSSVVTSKDGVVVSKSGLAAIAPVPPRAAVAPIGPVPPSAALTAQAGRTGYSYAYGYDDDDRFVIVSGKMDSFTMSGTGQDAHHVERLKKQIPGDFIWFQRDEKSYIIRDQATIDRARKFWDPQGDLGKKQEELGKQQEALGKQQEALGHKMEQVRVNVPDMTSELDKLKAELKALGPTATQDQLAEIQSEIGEMQSRFGEMQSHAGEQQSRVGEEMSALGEQQSKLGEQQDALGRQQEEAARQATHKMKELLDESIKNGTAQPEPPINQGGTI